MWTSSAHATSALQQVSESADSVYVKVKIQVWGLPNLYTEVYRKVCDARGLAADGTARIVSRRNEACGLADAPAFPVHKCRMGPVTPAA